MGGGLALGAAVRSTLVALKGRANPRCVPELAPATEIPRVIHQTSPTTQVSAAIRDNIERLTTANPGWDYRLWDDAGIEDFIASEYGPRVLEYYSRINPHYGACRADLFRYLLMYRIGGVYLDLKSTVTRPLGEIIRPGDRYLLSHWRNEVGQEFEGWGHHPEVKLPRGEFQQWHIIAAPGHPFLRAVILRVLANIRQYDQTLHGIGTPGAIRVTGPVAYSLALIPLLDRFPYRLIDAHAGGIIYSIFGRQKRHRSLFKTHYAVRRDPVVLPKPENRVISAVWCTLRAAKRLCLGAFRAGRDKGETL